MSIQDYLVISDWNTHTVLYLQYLHTMLTILTILTYNTYVYSLLQYLHTILTYFILYKWKHWIFQLKNCGELRPNENWPNWSKNVFFQTLGTWDFLKFWFFDPFLGVQSPKIAKIDPILDFGPQKWGKKWKFRKIPRVWKRP